jgi:hypothetical protein
MELLTAICGILGGSVGSKIVADEIKAWCPAIAERIMRAAAQRLAPDQRERYNEEWASDLANVPGAVSRLIFALDLHRAAFGINRSLRKSRSFQLQKMGEEADLPIGLERLALISAFLASKIYKGFVKPPKNVLRPMDVIRLSDLKMLIIRPQMFDEIMHERMKGLGYIYVPPLHRQS